MDVPLAHQDIGFRHGLQKRKGKSSTFCHKTGVVGLSELFKMITLRNTNGKLPFFWVELTERDELSSNYCKRHYYNIKKLRICVR